MKGSTFGWVCAERHGRRFGRTCRIYIVDANGDEKEELACRMVEHGKTIKLTIDSELQKALYEQFKEDKSCSAAMNPYTAENTAEHPIMIVSMVEAVKGRGGSGYVVGKDKQVLESRFGRNE